MVQLRQAAAEDAALISRMISATWRVAYQDLIDPVYLARLPEEYWLPAMRSWLGSERMYGFIAKQDELPVGCVIYGRGRDEDHADWGEIASLYVLPEFAGQGVGSLLLNAAISALTEDGYSHTYLWSIRGNERAEQFYLRHGFFLTPDRIQYRIGNRDMTDQRLIREPNSK